ncbi:cytochrome C peroxidase [Methylomonas sp. LL1]|uniref:cytochrome c peroxidase n=1 Tax=Methylomonas sp. LL1 TaxID=2785785 RepID=UPI0018C3A3A6|nr:cytochrome c peroxidase [Methylomonas sp. LL1]QPK63974.1 cytochrome C peroxidase [Methylomonas sp. LL1]
MRLTNAFVLWGGMIASQVSWAHGPLPVSLQRVPVPPVPGLTDAGTNSIVVNKDMAIALGKALFWDVNVGSDGMACGSCHFHAGADSRVKNQVNPGLKSSLPSGETFDQLPSGVGAGGPNYTMNADDFPLYKYADPLNQSSAVVFKTDDVVSSAGTFSGTYAGTSRLTGEADQCERSVDPIFHVNGVGTRRVEPRNAPTVINTIFNHRNFWDGRANNIYNGSSPWGNRDPNAGVWVKVNARSVQKQRLNLINSSLASLAMGPPLNDAEMSCRQRTWQEIGRKLLLRQPLQNQKVHNEDSVFAPMNLSLSSAGDLKPGLSTTYKNMIKAAFNQKYWSYSGLGQFGGPVTQPYDQMEANFSMFFGIALQLYQSTLVSDQAPIDLTPRTAGLEPTWEGMGYTPEQIASLQNGFGQFVSNHCNLCHGGPLATTAAIVPNSTLVTTTPGATYGPITSPIAYGPNALGPLKGGYAVGIDSNANVLTRDGMTGGVKFYDFGFANTGVGDPDADPGIGGVDDFGNPLSFSSQYVEYLLNNTAGVLDPKVNQVKACDFIRPLSWNVAGVVSTEQFTPVDGVLLQDGSKEGVLRNTGCIYPSFPASKTAYIPSPAMAAAAIDPSSPNYNPGKMDVATKAVFKIPTLRNVELTGPYMHNGSMATLEQVVEFYSRFGNVNNENKHLLLDSITLASNAQNRADLVAFLKTFTDDRVKKQKAPFDHPEVIVPHGHAGDNHTATPGDPLQADWAIQETLTIPAVGANGSDDLQPFDSFLAP